MLHATISGLHTLHWLIEEKEEVVVRTWRNYLFPCCASSSASRTQKWDKVPLGVVCSTSS